MSYDPERDRRWIFRGRLALALAGRRANNCTNPRCARERHCLAKIPSLNSWTTPPCHVMTEAEWDAYCAGLGGTRDVMQPFYFAQDAKALAERKRLPKAERDRLEEFDREKERVRRILRERYRYKPTLWEMIWLEPSEDAAMKESGVAKAERALIENAIRIGCRCASEGMVADCERCEGWWLGKVVAAAAKVKA